MTAPAAAGGRWYTHARRVPQLIGVTADGTRLPGGPYTVTQFIAGIATAGAAYWLMPLWARFGLVWNTGIFVGLVVAVVVVSGRIPAGRNPLSLLAGVVRACGAPAWGTVGGRPLRPVRVTQVRHLIHVVTTPTAPVTRRVPRSRGHDRPGDVRDDRAAGRARTSLEQLLATTPGGRP